MDCAVEQVDLLWHEAQQRSALAVGQLEGVAPGDVDGSGGDRVEAGEEGEQGGLAGAGAADDGDVFTRFDAQADVVQDRLAAGVAEDDVVGSHRRAGDVGRVAVGRVGVARRGGVGGAGGRDV